MPQPFAPEHINDPFGDPGLYVDLVFARRALMFDLGDLAPLPLRKLLRVSEVFVTFLLLTSARGQITEWSRRTSLAGGRR